MNSDWNRWLAPHVEWKEAYAWVDTQVRAFFALSDATLTTAALVEVLYPEAAARGPGITARKRIFSALEALSKHGLKDYWEPGTPRPLKHNKAKLVTPKVWRAPPPKVPTPVRRWVEQYDGLTETFPLVLSNDGPYVLYEDIKHLL